MPLFSLTHGAILNSYRKWRGITVFRVTIGESIYYFCVSHFSYIKPERTADSESLWIVILQVADKHSLRHNMQANYEYASLESGDYWFGWAVFVDRHKFFWVVNERGYGLSTA